MKCDPRVAPVTGLQRNNTAIICFFQMDITMLADHIMEASTCGLKQGALEAETDSGKVGMGSDVRFLSGYLSEVERLVSDLLMTSPKKIIMC